MKKKYQTIAASKAITNTEENGKLKRSEDKRNIAKRYFRGTMYENCWKGRKFEFYQQIEKIRHKMRCREKSMDGFRHMLLDEEEISDDRCKHSNYNQRRKWQVEEK
ncbi:hypothetical protein CEXT_316131 [Caerostris extrusa]|uniref:Uncharacterized protein n=1 Tax=Caerostris extrusa TaxID=172846 RepID=A0AAV4ML91_CAEEX|nr:hypothetical protein CEXT_316131 [Caerostris extrusa]